MITSIVIDATHFADPQPTGVEQYVDNLLPLLSEYLLRQGVTVFWVSHSQIKPDGVPPGVQWLYSPPSRFWSQLALLKILSTINPSIFFSPSGLAPLRFKGAFSLTFHDLAVYQNPAAFSFGEQVRLKWAGKRLARKARLLFTPSRFTQHCIEKIWHIPAEKIKITPLAFTPPPPVEAVPIGALNDFPIISYIGRLETKKNLLTVIRAFAKLSPALSCQLVLAGKPGYGKKKIKRLIKSLPNLVLENIHLTGYISEAQKRWLLSASKCLLVPSSLEGFGLPVLEGFYYKVPVVCAQAGSLVEVAGKAALYAQSDSATDWMLQIQKILTDTTLAAIQKEAGLERLSSFSWQKTAQLTAAALLEVA